MADSYNKKAYEKTLERIVDQHKVDHKKGDSRTDLQHMKENMTNIAKQTTKKIEDAARMKDNGGKRFYAAGSGESIRHV